MVIMRDSRDVRLVSVVAERVFGHLLKQSDAVIKHEIEGAYGVSVDDEDDDEMPSDEEDGEQEGPVDGPLDPRAGGVDVEIPELPVDYNRFYEELLELAGDPGVKQKTRTRLYHLVEKFKHVASDKYPYPDYNRLLKVDPVEPLREEHVEEAITRLQVRIRLGS
jgi:ribosomal RNA-processing protein 1